MMVENGTKKIIVKDISETEAFAKSFLEIIENDPERKRAEIVALLGDLGSGKTAFTKIFARLLGITETVTSPTFVLERIYKLPPGKKFRHLIHIDAYRLDSSDELKHLGFEDLANDPKNIIVIEWPERVPGMIPVDARKITFTHTNSTDPVEREISLA